MAANNVKVIEARPSDIESLTTIVARSFHPVNPYIKSTFPDTPAVREWWKLSFTDEEADPQVHLLIAVDPATDKDIGVLTLRSFGAEEKGVGVWTSPNHAWPADIDHEKCSAMIDSMQVAREKMMLGRPSYFIQLFGVDQKWTGKRVGLKLLARACEIADEKGLEVFVQANMHAASFYEKLGFETKETETMPGGNYVEHMMIRQPR